MRCGNERERTILQSVIVKKQTNVRFSCVCPVIDNEFRHNIILSKWSADPLGYRLVDPKLLWQCYILGDPGAVSGGGKKSKRPGEKKIRAKKLFPTPTNCQWVSEDAPRLACVAGVEVEGKGKKRAREAQDEGAHEACEAPFSSPKTSALLFTLLLALSLPFYGLPRRLRRAPTNWTPGGLDWSLFRSQSSPKAKAWAG